MPSGGPPAPWSLLQQISQCFVSKTQVHMHETQIIASCMKNAAQCDILFPAVAAFCFLKKQKLRAMEAMRNIIKVTI